VSSSEARLPAPEGPGSVSGAPNLPAGFTGTFTSRYVDTGELRLHAVTGGGGPPLLLVHGWPQTWYAWRILMPALARDYFGAQSQAACCQGPAVVPGRDRGQRRSARLTHTARPVHNVPEAGSPAKNGRSDTTAVHRHT
jgi:hypothetical protein